MTDMAGSLVADSLVADSLGANVSRLLNRNCGFANSQPSAPCAERAIAMLIIPIHGEAGCETLLATKSRAESVAILDRKFESQSNEYNE